MDTEDQRPLPVQLEYETPRRDRAITEVAAIYAMSLTFGVALGILVSAAGLIFLYPGGQPGSAACLLTSPITLLFTYMSCKAGGTYPSSAQRYVVQRRKLQWAFVVGFLLPTLAVVVSKVRNTMEINITIEKCMAVTMVLSLFLGPFLTGGWLVRRSASPNHLPNQRDTQQDH